MRADSNLKKYLALFLCITWISQIYLLYPTPTQEISQWVSSAETSPDSFIWEGFSYKGDGDIKEERLNFINESIGASIWKKWMVKLFIIFYGLFTAVYYLLKHETGKGLLGIFITSFIYLIYWSFNTNIFFADVTFIELLKTKLMIANQYNTKLFFYHKDILLPMVYIITCLFCFFEYVRLKAIHK